MPTPYIALRRWVLAAVVVALLLPLLASCAAFDKRRNCNHPQHEDWVKERQMRGQRVQDRRYRQ